ncbi:cupredoxin domain-containing protein [Paucibacter soli]|uniref:cupredoxin domain-containing protein n=1 Tax=Paucibacter soli TaxID=3133433 RepID=UPI00309F0DFC
MAIDIKAWAVAMLLSLGASCAQAHGAEQHAGALRKEQKAWGIAADPKAATRTVRFVMSDNMRFTPARLQVRRGETLRIVLKNEGAMLHEFVLGTKAELDAHAALMLKFPDMEHDEPYMAHVPAGRQAEIIWTFNRAGEFDFACLIAGHYQAGMVGKIQVNK